MPSIHLRETLTALLADWVYLHGVPAVQETMSAAEINAACDRLATKVDELAFRRQKTDDRIAQSPEAENEELSGPTPRL